MPRLICTNIHSEQGTGSGCQCAGCQDAVGTAMLGGPEPAPANGSADVPGDLTTGISLTLGTPITGVLEVNGDHDWYAVDLVAGTRYQITLNGVALDGYGALEDPYLYLRNADGVLIAQNDDIRNGVLRNSRLNWVATETGRFFLDAGAWNEGYAGGYQLSIIEFVPPTYTLDEIADFLTTGFWGDGDRRWDISTDNIITYNVTGLTSAGQTLARAAFQSWSNVTNLVFEEVTSGGNITLDDNQSGAFASSSVSNGFITSAGINIGIGWLNSYGTAIDSYSFQTYVHEIGHALGLGHGGAYNMTATYGVDNLYQNDIWSYTIMSYFDQSDANFGTYRVVMGPSLADIVAVHNHYGANTIFNSGDNVYGRNANAGSLYDFANYATAPAFSIYDTGGSDTLDASGYGVNQTINLNAETFSSIGGITNNIAIARGVIIEGAIGGGGADSVLGSSGDNILVGNAGADTLNGGTGDDSLIGGDGLDLVTYADLSDAVTVNLASNRATSAAGNDTFSAIENVLGGNGADSILGDAAANVLTGGNGADTLNGGTGDDSLIGGDGLDLVTYADLSDAVTVDLASNRATNAAGNDTFSAIENVLGGDGADSILGDAVANFLAGGNGADTLIAGDAAGQRLYGAGLAMDEAGTDSLVAGSGDNQWLSGGAGADTLRAGIGNAQELLGGTGNDWLVYDQLTEASQGATVDLSLGTSFRANIAHLLNGIENVLGGAGADSLFGNAATNALDGGANSDTLNGGAGDDRLIGGDGFDIADYGSALEAFSTDLAIGLASGSGLGSDTLIGIEGILGGQGNDNITGDTANNMLSGNAGDDTLMAGNGNDSLAGGAGNDMLIADGVGDYLNGGDGDDVVIMGTTQLTDILALFGAQG